MNPDPNPNPDPNLNNPNNLLETIILLGYNVRIGWMYRGEVLRACFRHFLLCFHFLKNLQISTQE